MSTEQVYSAKQAAELLKVHKVTIVKWLKSGAIPAFKLGIGPRAEWRVKHNDLMIAINEHPVKLA
jgi:excisionase family DNA binding protein